MVADTSEVNLLVIDIEIYYLFRILNKYLCMQKVSITCLLYDIYIYIHVVIEVITKSTVFEKL